MQSAAEAAEPIRVRVFTARVFAWPSAVVEREGSR
jgi:hypothetical protein